MFKLIQEGYADFLGTPYYLYEHSILKTKHLHLKNKAKSLGFLCKINTPCFDETGVSHILEHCILDGSKKYSRKDINNIFENSADFRAFATTRINKTEFQVSTESNAGYYEALDIILDSIFNPNLSKESFLKEGWRFDIDENNNLKVKGIVFNEMYEYMKTYSSQHKHFNVFDGINDVVNMGGYPTDIIDLSYEDLKKYYQEYYHPSNMLFITIGKNNSLKTQQLLEEYLDNYNFKEFNNIDSKQFILNKNKETAITINADKEFKKGELLDSSKYYYLGEKTPELEIFNNFIAQELDTSKYQVYFKKSNGHSFLEDSYINNDKKDSKEFYRKLDELKNNLTTQKINKFFNSFKPANIAENHYSSFRDDFNYITSTFIDDNKLNTLETKLYIKKLKYDFKILFAEYVDNSILNNYYWISNAYASGEDTTDFEILDKKIKDIASNLTESDILEIKENNKLVNKITDEEVSYMDIKEDTIEVLYDSEEKDIDVNGIKVKAYIESSAKFSSMVQYYPITNINEDDLLLLGLYKYVASRLIDESFSDNNRNYLYLSSYFFNFVNDLEDTSKYYVNLTISAKMRHNYKLAIKTLNNKVNKLKFNKDLKLLSKILDKYTYYINSDDYVGTFSSTTMYLSLNEDFKVYDNFIGSTHANHCYFMVKDCLKSKKKLSELAKKLQTLHSKLLENNEFYLNILSKDEAKIKTIANYAINENTIDFQNDKAISFNCDSNSYNAIVNSEANTNINYAAQLHNVNKINDRLFKFILESISDVISQTFAKNVIREQNSAYSYNVHFDRDSYIFSIRVYKISDISSNFKTLQLIDKWIINNKQALIDECLKLIEQEKIRFSKRPHILKIINEVDAQILSYLIDDVLLKGLKNAKLSGIFNKQQYDKENIDLNAIEITPEGIKKYV